MQPRGEHTGRDRPVAGDAIDQFPLIVWTTDRDLRFTSSHGAGLAALGLEPGEVIGRSLFEYFGTDDTTFPPIAEHQRAVLGETRDFDVSWDGRIFRTHVGPLLDGSGTIVGTSAFALDVTEERTAQEAAGKREELLIAISTAARRLLAAAWEDVAPDMLAALGKATDVSRAYAFENVGRAEEPLRMRQRFEWVAPGIRPFIDEPLLQDLAFEEGGFGRWVEVLASGGVIAADVSELPAPEQAILREQDIRSICAVPIHLDGSWWGFLGFDECRSERTWSEAEIGELQAAAALLGAAISRQRADEGTRHAEERYRTLVEQLPVVVYREAVDDGTALYVSPQYEHLFGYPPAARLADPNFWFDHLHPEDRQRIGELARVADETGEPFSAEYRYVASDGRAVWVRDEAVLLRDEDGEPLLWQGILLDITQQKELERAHRESELRYRSVVENVPVITYVEGPGGQGDPRFISPQVEAILGYTPEEWLAGQHSWTDKIHPDDLTDLLAIERDTQVTLEPFHAEYRLRAKDGRWVWLQDDALPVRDESGNLLFWQGIQQDITEQRQAEEALREAEQRYRAIVEHIPAATYVDAPDSGMRTIFVSPQIERILGITQQAYIDDPNIWLDLIPDPGVRQEIAHNYVRAIDEGRDWVGEYPIRRPDGREIWVHDETTFVRDKAGRPLFLQGVLYDVTERRSAEQSLRESERREREAAERLRALDDMKNTFLAAVSHELRSPLTSVLGLAITLEQQPGLPVDERTDLLRRVAANARKLDVLLRDLLDIDRLSRGIVTPRVKPTDVGAVAQRVVRALEVPDTVAIELDAGSVVISADAPKVERIVENLVMNAVRHTDPTATIWVRTFSQDGGAVIVVEDDGPGVPADLRRAIFEPFRQGPSASSHNPGTGIGLSLVAMFAELHGGRAWVQDRDGGGASFRVFLPGEAQSTSRGDDADPNRGGPAWPVHSAAAG